MSNQISLDLDNQQFLTNTSSQVPILFNMFYVGDVIPFDVLPVRYDYSNGTYYNFTDTDKTLQLSLGIPGITSSSFYGSGTLIYNNGSFTGSFNVITSSLSGDTSLNCYFEARLSSSNRSTTYYQEQVSLMADILK